MDKKICKYETSNILRNSFWYYGMLLLFFILVVVTTKGVSLEINEGVNFFTIIFLASQPLIRLKSDFNFSKINNISRKNFIKGTLESGILISSILSAIDIILIKIFSLFSNSFNMYEVFFQNFIEGTFLNIIKNLVASWIYISLVYFLIYITFLLFSTVYLKLSNEVKKLWAVGFVVVIVAITNLIEVLASSTGYGITPIAGILLLIILCGVLIILEFLISKNLQESVIYSNKKRQ
ncbi:MAG: hypothetical protein SOY42_06395 [Clostridium sp.]|nr:hypothetical protein [Clostridium sp.]